ncbi:MAG: cell envelope integrity protein TolA, partial [Alphaproteobacteria bacterium]|nr:cell envelope integrity protein TolA [Alphaproteobacteria bacterium]
AILHLLILILFGVSIGNPFKTTLKDDQPMVIDFVQIGDKSAAPKLSPINQKAEEPKPLPKPEKPVEPPAPEPEESRVEKKELPPPPPEEPKKPEEKPAPEPKEPEPSKEEVDPILKKKPEKKEPKKKKEPEKKKETPKKPEKKEPEKKKKPEKDKKDPKKKDKKKTDEKAEVNLKKKKASTAKDKKPDSKNKKDSKSALDDLLKDVNDDSSTTEDGSPAETVGEVITATQIDAIRQKIRKCWLVPAGLKGAKDMVVDIKMEIAQDGTVTKADIVDKSRMAEDSGFRTAAENARRAVLDPQCNPLPLPADKYEQWKDLEMSFNPKDMF